MAETSKIDECEDAYVNPRCPYVTVINQSTVQIQDLQENVATIKKALIGDDMQGGLINKMNQLWLTHKAEIVIVTLILGVVVARLFGATITV